MSTKPPEAFDEDLPQGRMLTEEESREMKEDLAREYFDMSLDEFIQAWKAGEFDGDEERHGDVVFLASMLPEYWEVRESEEATPKSTPSEDFPGWRVLEDIGAGDGVPTECERCGKPGTPRQQFQHMGVTICYLCADERVDELRMKGVWGFVQNLKFTHKPTYLHK